LKKILIIQTAFIGDVILATSLIETIIAVEPNAIIDFVLRKGNETLLNANPKLRKVIIWDKSNGKYKSLFATAKEIRTEKYDLVINLQRFASSGYLAWRAKAKFKTGFSQNPFSFCFSNKLKHQIGNGKHEIQRNFELIQPYFNSSLVGPKLYPSTKESEQVSALNCPAEYVTMAPSSVWFTKQLPLDKWIELIQKTNQKSTIYLLGGITDQALLDEIKTKSQRSDVINLAGKINLLASALLMQGAKMNYVNDSGPLHLASAMNAPVTAFFCSTVPEFGFGPLSENSKIIQTTEKLSCRPCGLHGFKVCPKGHFKCGNNISIQP
jgi:lipopolysaccharide heptosyltransferase II